VPVLIAATPLHERSTVITYLTGVSNEITRAAQRPDLGLLGTPAGSTWKQRDHYTSWAADNGCFAELHRPGAFKPDRWLAWLETAGADQCLFATLPDVVGDAVKTWERSAPYAETVRNLGFPVAIVLQDGLEHEPGIWSELLGIADAVFVGGSTEWKLGHAARRLCHQARHAGKHVHVGRVNSRKRLLYVADFADSADGTYLNYGRKEDRARNTQRLLSWLDEVNR
jgi:hypothetical protein